MFGSAGGFCGRCGGRFCGFGVCLFKEDEVVVVELVPDEVDAAVDLVDCVNVVFGEVCGDADQPRGAGVYLFDGFFAEFVSYEFADVGFVVKQPVKVEEALVDDVFAD